MKKLLLIILIIAVCGGTVAFVFLSNTVNDQGSFYTLEEAFEKNYITLDDLKNIAYYQNGGSHEEGFVPKPKNPETLSNEIVKLIKETETYELRNKESHPIKNAKLKDVTIKSYYGTYNDYVAVLTTNANFDYPDAIKTVYIGGVKIVYGNLNFIKLWKQK